MASCYSVIMTPTRKTRWRIAAGQPVPTDPPKHRKPTTDGYIELWWHLGPATYITALEHRIVTGRVTEAENVHHINGNRKDNRPENLLHLTVEEHQRIHAEKNSNVDWASVPDMYRSGMTTTQIAKAVGSWPGNVSRQLRARGVQPAHKAWNKMTGLDAVVLQMHAEGLRPPEIARRLDTTRTPIDRILKAHGIKPYPPGRPQGSQGKAPRSGH